jgi:hypothetical protein
MGEFSVFIWLAGLLPVIGLIGLAGAILLAISAARKSPLPTSSAGVGRKSSTLSAMLARVIPRVTLHASALLLITFWPPLAIGAGVSLNPFESGLGLVQFHETKKFVFIDRRGNVVLSSDKIAVGKEEMIDSVYPFKNGLAMVSVRTTGMFDRKVGFIDMTGRWAIRPVFDRAHQFWGSNPAWAAAKKHGGKWGFIDRKGKWAIKPRFDEALSFRNGYAKVRLGETDWGLLDQEGKFAIQPQSRYGVNDDVVGNAVWVFDSQLGRVGLMELYTGRWIIQPEFDSLEDVFDGKATVCQKSGDCFVVDSTGARHRIGSFSAKFSSVYMFRDGVAPACDKYSGACGLIDTSAQWVMKPKFQNMFSWAGENLWKVATSSKLDSDVRYQYFDKEGTPVIKIPLKTAGLFSDGLAPVEDDSGQGYMTKEGVWAISPDNMRRTLARWYEAEYIAGQDRKEPGRASAQSNNSYPARPPKRPGVVSCNTNCINGDCWRTYDSGRKVRFQAQHKYNPLSGQFEWDSGSC